MLDTKRLFASLAGICLFLLGSGQSIALAEATTAPSNAYLRYVADNDGNAKLETSVVTLKNDDGVMVHLVAAVHVADKKYYDRLNGLFKSYDSLLYEMVKPKDAGVPEPGQGGHNAVSVLQRTLKNVLGLQFQLDAVNYSASNFVHADLDAETFEEKQAERGESLLGLMLQQILNEMAQGDEDQTAPEVQMAQFMVALTSPDRPRQLKMLLGKQFEDLDRHMAGMDGPNGSVLVTERNKAALEVLKKQIDKGDKNIGIFYGAAHMRDLQERLEEMHFKETDSKWLTAWDLSVASTQPAKHE